MYYYFRNELRNTSKKRTKPQEKNKRPLDIDEIITSILAAYPQITLSNILYDPVYKGGITPAQLNVLYEKAAIRQHNNYRILASFQGVKIPAIDEMKKPEDKYADWTDEEKQAETERQMKQFAKAFGQGSIEIINKD